MVALMKMVEADERLGAERRTSVRRPSRQCAEGRRMDHTIAAQRQPRLSLNLRDLSAGGLSAQVEIPLEPGERLSVSLPAQGLKMGWHAIGRVLRCQPSGLGYRIAMEFDPVSRAA